MSYTKQQIKYIQKSRLEGKSWQQVADDYNDFFGTQKAHDALRQALKKNTDDDVLMVSSLKAKSRAQKRSSILKKENDVLVDNIIIQEDFLKEFKNILKNSPIEMFEPPKKTKSKKKFSRTIFAHLSDVHFEANIDSEEMGDVNKYGRTEQARRFAYYCKQVAEYKIEHRDQTELVIALNGDILQGIIHNQESTSPMTTQFSAGMHLITQGISYLANNFKKVRVICTTGNHARFMHKSEKGRVTKQKWDGFHTILHIALDYYFKSFNNVEFEIPTTPYAHVDIQGHKFFITHTDTVLTLGNIGKTVSTKLIKDKVNDLMSGLGHIDVVVGGHVHVPLYTTLNNGVELVVNGSMSGVDEFCQSIGILNNIPAQQIFEITPDYAVGDMRVVRLVKADKMKELDQIISPFSGKF